MNKKKIKLCFINDDKEKIYTETNYIIKDEMFNILNQNYTNMKNELDYKIDGCVKYFKLPSLNDKFAFEKTLSEIRESGKKYNILLDIRNNIGGRLSLSAKLTGIFLKKDAEIYLKNRDDIEVLKIKAENNDFKYPIGILFNNMTSSSLEYIFLTNLLEHEKILMMGNITSGMKDVATVYKLNDRYTLILTTKQYVDENGRCLKCGNIIPQISIPVDINDFSCFPDKQLMKAIDVMKKGAEI